MAKIRRLGATRQKLYSMHVPKSKLFALGLSHSCTLALTFQFIADKRLKQFCNFFDKKELRCSRVKIFATSFTHDIY